MTTRKSRRHEVSPPAAGDVIMIGSVCAWCFISLCLRFTEQETFSSKIFKISAPKKRIQGTAPPSTLRIKKTLRHSFLILHKPDITKNKKENILRAALPKKEKGGGW